MILTIKNPSQKLVKAIKAMANVENTKVTLKESSMERALKEIRNGEVIKCKNFEDFKRKILA
ncbi:hypothetical protein FTT16_08765 [Campylobacter jejuni]|nr:hypothetical protein [Campylobacter jejuni]